VVADAVRRLVPGAGRLHQAAADRSCEHLPRRPSGDEQVARELRIELAERLGVTGGECRGDCSVGSSTAMQTKLAATLAITSSRMTQSPSSLSAA
jgi:hypothetical protein